MIDELSTLTYAYIAGTYPGPATQMQKQGRMIVLKKKNIPLSLTFTRGKKDPFFEKRCLGAPENNPFSVKMPEKKTLFL